MSTKTVSHSEAAPPAVAEEGADHGTEARRSLLSRMPPQLGASWARGWCEALRAEGRSIDGGWPGTLQEARSRVILHFDGELSRRGMAVLTPQEVAAATAATYERARQDWTKKARAAQRPRTRTPARGKNDET